MENKIEGWAIDTTSKKRTHYYKSGQSLCKRALTKHFMNSFDDNINYTQILGYTCDFCSKKLKKI